MKLVPQAPDPALESWLHLYLQHFSSPGQLKSLIESLPLQQRQEAIFAACAQIPVAQICQQKPLVESAIGWAEAEGDYLLPLYSDQYPALLYQVADPPAVLFVRGAVQLLSLPQIALVGSRQPSPDGRRTANEFAAKISAAGFVVTSGLAYGIDAQSHQGSLAGTGKTIAVLGSGIDCIYPAKHRPLAGEIVKTGALVSEFLPGAHANDWHFPRRNRIISGLCYGVVVVEAAQRSGSLITARLALDQGREVFAIPGSIRNPKTRGCHWLLKNGAKLVESLDDILEELPTLLAWTQSHGLASCQGSSTEPAAALIVEQQDQRILDEIGYDGVTVEQLVACLQLSVADLTVRLAVLELQGLVSCESGAYRRGAQASG